MQIHIVAINKLKTGPEQALYNYYVQRLPWKVTCKEYELKKAPAPSARKEKEAELLLAGCEGADRIIALDAAGKQMTSPALAAYIHKARDNSARTFAFVIGGADGLHESVLTKAHLTLSLGLVTWPHMLMRVLLAEQLYRAHTIITGHPYHRE